MPNPRIILALCFVFLAASGSREQQSVTPLPKPAAHSARASHPVAPPPKPTDDGPCLEVTMKFIQDKLSEMGPIAYSVSVRDPGVDMDPNVETWREEYSNVVADTQGCTISYRQQFSRGNRQPENFNYSLYFKAVKKIRVQSFEQFKNDLQAKIGSKAEYTIRPPVFIVMVEGGPWFTVDEEELANRFARAINHAVELCTPDKKPEPF
jgi:hypothetical protein